MAELFRDPGAPPTPAEYLTRFVPGDERLLEGDEPAWARATPIAWGPAAWRTEFRALWTTAALWVRFDCRDLSPWRTMHERDDHLWNEEVVELFVDPAGAGRDYAEIEISPFNVVCDLRVHDPWPRLHAELAWDFAGLETRVVRGGAGESGNWIALARLPWDGFTSLSPAAAGRLPPQPGDRWRFNVFRIKRPGGPSDPEGGAIYAAWSVPEGPSFHVPAVFRDLVFATVD